jgi:hypothetical protein
LPAGLELASGRTRQDIGYLQGGQKKEVIFKVKMTKPVTDEVEVTYSSTRGGVEKKKVPIASSK